MPVYEYEHTDSACRLGERFEVTQSIEDRPLARCPECREPVRKLISLASISTPKSDAELRDMGFTNLVRRDDGVYENVTRRGSDSRYMERDKPDTMPNLKKTISD